MTSPNDTLFRGLDAVGALLASRGEAYSCVVAGGACLAARGVIERATGDVDVMAVRDNGGELKLAPREFPPAVARAISEVAHEFNMPEGWMNTTMARGLVAGPPPGFEERIEWRQFGALHVGLVDRKDLIALKLEAASDDPPHGRTDVHLGDLIALGATQHELDEAARWVKDVNVDPRRDQTIAWVKQRVAEASSR